MKKLTILLFSFTALISLTQCNNSNPDMLLQNSETRGKVISKIVHDHNYTNELMDSMMQSNHAMMMLRGNHEMMRMMSSENGSMDMMSDSTMDNNMMNN